MINNKICFPRALSFLVHMKRSSHVVSASDSLEARQCRGTTLRGVRCSISSKSKFASKDGRDLALPLRRGCDYCFAHLPVLVTCQTEWDASTSVLVFYLDFETSGLDIFSDHIVEIGILCESGECFSTVCNPPVLTPGPHVHGIGNEELQKGPAFEEAFTRMMTFVHGLILTCVQSCSSSDDEDAQELPPTRFRQSDPEVLIVAHNGRKFDIPLLLSECFRNSIPWERDLVAWNYVDTLDVVKALDTEAYGGCQKLQCLLQLADCCELKAHRALDDCKALRNVVHHLAAWHGVSALSLLRPFVFSVECSMTSAHIATLCENNFGLLLLYCIMGACAIPEVLRMGYIDKFNEAAKLD